MPRLLPFFADQFVLAPKRKPLGYQWGGFSTRAQLPCRQVAALQSLCKVLVRVLSARTRLLRSFIGSPAGRSHDFSSDPTYRGCLSTRTCNFFQWDLDQVVCSPFISPINGRVISAPPASYRVRHVFSITPSAPHGCDFLVHTCADPILALLQKSVAM